jgi:putative oxidoreductase
LGIRMSPKVKKILMWVCIALLTLQFAAASAGKLTGAAEKRFIDWGYSATFSYIIGSLELLGAIGLFFPKFRMWAACGLMGIMIGAAYTHLTHNESSRLIHNSIVSLIAVGVIYFSRKQDTSVT